MARTKGIVLLAAGMFAACGGEGIHNDQDGAAGVARMDPRPPGAGGKDADGSSHSLAGSAGVPMAEGGRAGGGAGVGGGASGAGTSGESGAGGAAGSGDISTPEVLVPTVQAFCAAARACCAADETMLDDCESGFAERDQTSRALARGTVEIDAADLAKCQAAYAAAATSCYENDVLAACGGIVHGTVAEGEACFFSQECAGAGPKVCAVTGGQDAPGVCKAAPGGKVGDECSLTCRPNEVCSFTIYGVTEALFVPCLESDGVFCDSDSAPAKCQAIRAVGALCERDEQCGFAAYCDGGATGMCKKRGQLNDACGTCILSLMCKDGTCQSRPLTGGGTCAGYSLGPT